MKLEPLHLTRTELLNLRNDLLLLNKMTGSNLSSIGRSMYRAEMQIEKDNRNKIITMINNRLEDQVRYSGG